MPYKKLKLELNEFRDYLLDRSVDENGEKISDRDLWSTEEFFNDTGMYKVDKYTKKRIMCSTGTISFYKRKLNLKERDVYDYHYNITNKIKIDYESWSKMYNKGHEKQSRLSDEVIKRKLIEFIGFADSCIFYTYDRVRALAYRTWEDLGLDADKEMGEFYKWLKQGGDNNE